MDMINHDDIIPNTAEWLEFRTNYGGASEAAAMLGIDPDMSRNELLRLKKTGKPRPVDAFTQKIFDKGHEIEALARPIAEKFIDEDLYIACRTRGYLLATLDGITMCENVIWEHKQWNNWLPHAVARQELPDKHMAQVQQQLYVTGAARALFTVSDGTSVNAKQIWVEPCDKWQRRLIDGWRQFQIDKDAFEVTEPEVKAIASKVETLPTLAVQVSAEVISSNMPVCHPVFRGFLEKVNLKPVTDQEYVDLDRDAKEAKRVHAQMAMMYEAATAPSRSVYELTSKLKLLMDDFKDFYTNAEKIIRDKKDRVKQDAIDRGRSAIAEYIKTAQSGLAEFGEIRLPQIQVNFTEAAKNKRTMETLTSAIDAEIANGKIQVDNHAQDFRIKLEWFSEVSKGGSCHIEQNLLLAKPLDDYKLIVKTKIDAYAREQSLFLEPPRTETEAPRSLEKIADDVKAALRRQNSGEISEQQRNILKASERVIDLPVIERQITIQLSEYNRLKECETRLNDLLSAGFGVDDWTTYAEKTA